MEELKKLVEEQNKAWNEFKAEQDKGAQADRVKLTKLNEAMDAAEKKLAAAEQKAQARVDELEKKVNRLELAGAGRGTDTEKPERKAYEHFLRDGRTKLTDAEQKSLIVADDTKGGVLAPVELVKEIIKDVVLFSPVRKLIRIRPTGQRGAAFPKRTQTAAARWVGETESRTETQNPAYGLEEITADELVAVAYISMADLEDSLFDIEGEIRAEFAEQFGVSEGAAVISGNGKGKPLGILDAASGITFVKSGSASALADKDGQADGIVDLVHDLKTAYAANATMGFNRKTLGELRKLKDAQKRYIFEPSPAVGMPSLILNTPYVELPDMPDIGANTFPIAYGDWRRAYIGIDRLQLAIVRDELTQAENGLVKFVGRRRFGGKVVLPQALRLLKCAA